MINKMGRYKFSNGDTVGLFEYNEKILYGLKIILLFIFNEL